MSVKKTTQKKTTEKKTTKSTKKTTSADSSSISEGSIKKPDTEEITASEKPQIESVKSEPIKEEKQPEPVKEEIKPEPVKEEIKPEPVKEEIKPDTSISDFKPVESDKEDIKLEAISPESNTSSDPIVEEEGGKKKKRKDKEKKEKKAPPEFVGKLKTGIEKLPTGLHETENKLKLTTSKLFALTGSLFAIFEGRQLLLWSFNAMYIVAGIISVLAGFFIFITLNIIDFEKILKKKMPYEWFILMGVGFLVMLLNRIAASIYWIKGGVLMMIGGLILLMQSNIMPPKIKLLKENQLICLIGVGIGIYEAIKLLITNGGNFWQIVTAFVVFGFMVLLFLSLGLIPIKLPKELQFSWWGVLTIGMAMYYLGYQLSGIVIIHVFLLILISL